MKFSRQRAAILSFLQSRKDHPTAEVVYSNVKEEFPSISLGTVYRNLNQLAETGMIAKQHFVCNCCNAVIDLPIDGKDFASIDAEASKGFDGLIQGHRLYFCGICKNCLDQGLGQEQIN